MTFRNYQIERDEMTSGFKVYRDGSFLRPLPGQGAISHLIEEVEILQREVARLKLLCEVNGINYEQTER